MQSTALPKWLAPSILAISFMGFLDATYLAMKYYLGGPINCVIFQGCDKVTRSAYGIIANVPVSVFGVFFYLTVMILAIIYLDTKNHFFIKLAAIITFFGFAATFWFLYLQIFIIKSLCTYCLISAGTSTLLFIGGAFILKTSQKNVN